MFDRYTSSACKVMALSRKETQRFRHDFIGTVHILLGLIRSRHTVWNSDLKIERVLDTISKHASPGPIMVTMGQLPFTPRAKGVLQFAMEEADQLGHAHIGTGHLLLGLIRQHDGTAVRVLLDLNLDLGRLRAEALRYVEAPDRGDECVVAPDGTITASWIMLILLLGIVAWVAYQCSSGP